MILCDHRDAQVSVSLRKTFVRSICRTALAHWWDERKVIWPLKRAFWRHCWLTQRKMDVNWFYADVLS